MTPEDRSKTFQNWLKATLSTSASDETIDSKVLIHREKYYNNNKWQNQNMFITVGYWEKSNLPITKPSVNVLCREWIIQHVSNWSRILCNQIWIPAIKFLERVSQSIDILAPKKRSIHWKFMTISKVIIICAASWISDKLWNAKLGPI